MKPTVLVVDDEKKIRTILNCILTDEGYDVILCESGEDAVAAVSRTTPDLVLMDQNMPGINGIETMGRLREHIPDLTVIILTAYGSIPLAVEAMRKGAFDYLTKPFDNDELLIVTERALRHTRMAHEIVQLKEELKDRYRFENIIGESPAMRMVFDQIQRVCETDATVLIQGESGTGKELVARAIHYHSKRKDARLVSVNCGAIPATLIESEFFGHEKGAFTDARDQRQGSFERAHTGTLFLDEIGELPQDAQVKILRALEDLAITRIGGKETIPVDIRILAATNKNLENEVSAGHFRLDLLYRLNIFTITMPPLRERQEDIPLLVEHFLRKYNTKLGLDVRSIARSALNVLETYDWPGNVRDLENAIQSAMILTGDGVIDDKHLPLRVKGYPDSGDTMTIDENGLDEYLGEVTDKIEKNLVVQALEQHGYNRTQTAEALKISRKTLFNKMKKHGIEPRETDM